jgi:hypothetical protein
MKSITRDEMERFAWLSNNASYNEELKAEYRRLGRKIMKYIAFRLGLTSFDIRFNPGGIAVSGDNTLHDERFYLSLTDNCGIGSFYFRSCKGQRDYTGGPNQNVQWTEWVRNGIEAFIRTLGNKFYPERFQ